VAPKTIPMGEWNIVTVTQESEGQIHRFHGSSGRQAEMEDSRMFFRADEIEFNKETGDVRAQGRVYYRNFDKNEQLWADRVEYNTKEETGKFYEVRGQTQPKIVVRRGVLTSSNPFYFEGEWAERIGEKYIVYNGWVTNCKMPNPWWRMRGKKFDIIQEDRAISYRSTFILRKMPLFYAPVFYHSLSREPRKSGFLMPNFVPHSQRGFMVGLGYYWAISRNYDATYRFQDFTSNAFAHHVDFRGKPRVGTDFDFILYGVQDRGIVGGSNPPTYSGASIYAVGRSDLGNGWVARGYVNYISSFRFRQEWSESYNEAIGSEIHSVGFLNKNWSYYTFNAVFSRLQNYESTEIPITDPITNATSFATNAVTIRKMPEFQLNGRDRQLWKNLPFWFSFDSAAGVLFRSETIPNDTNSAILGHFQTSQFTPRMSVAPQMTGAFHFGDFDIVPSIGLQETFYGESQTTVQGLNQALGTDLVRSARDFSLDLIFPSLARVFDKKTIFGDKLKHVIEPRATYRYVTGIGTDFNRFIRFDETDLLSNTNELELSLTNRLYAKRGDSVQEIFSWEVAQKRYFDPTFGGALLSNQANVFQSTADLTAYSFLVGPRSTSPVVSTLRASPINGLGIQWQADYDPRYGRIVDSAFSVDYRWQRFFISAGNNEVRINPLVTPPANQYRGHFGFGDANRRGWNAAVDAVYDARKSVIQYSTAQVTYNTDCCGISVQYRRYNIGIRDESQFRIAFSIANIGTFGTLRKQDRLF
jgi:LPS-assembly protein